MSARQWVFWLESIPFTVDAITGKSSLGGSESAAIGMMQALARRGHDVQCFATRLEQPGEYDGVMWQPGETLGEALAWLTPDVFVALRLPTPYVRFRVGASLNILWNEDMLVDPGVVSTLAQVDELWYVSDYHRAQWEGREPLAAKMPSWVTKNGINPAHYPTAVSPNVAQWDDGTSIVRDAHRYIYISRPERALKPLLEMWPKIREADPKAVLGICRYRSMYDGEGTAVQRMVDDYDRMTERVAADVGGIEWLGQLGKRALAEQIARSRAMLYPGVADFAETSCIAALEAQACGTPLIGSWRGALPETLHPDAGILIDGDPSEDDYRAAYLAAVASVARVSDRRYAAMQDAGRTHVAGYAFDAIAAEWESHVEATFAARYQAHTEAVLKQLLHWDRHVMALDVATDIKRAVVADSVAHATDGQVTMTADARHRYDEADAIVRLCETVIAGEHQTAEDYAHFAIQDPLAEADGNTRFQAMVEAAEQGLGGRPASVLDVACGNGSLAIVTARAFPGANVRGVDYSSGVLALARAGVVAAGVADRVTFDEAGWQDLPAGPFDLVTCGEFIEHVEDPAALLNRLEAACRPGGRCVFTTPSGPFAELMEDPDNRKRGHLHTFSYQQINRLMANRTWTLRHLAMGVTRRGVPVGYWVVCWQPNPAQPVQPLAYAADIVATRPYQTVLGMMICKDGEDWLRKCLKSTAGVLDKVIIHDTGSADGSVALARSMGAIVTQTDWPESFCVARNRVLADATARGADWVLWIDCDEMLEDQTNLRRYTTGAGPFLGYVIRQQHLMLDAEPFHDKPVRLFRTGAGIRFYGAIHEQPETAPDAGVWPALEIPDCEILHLGYHRDRQRREKLLTRNLPLLQKQLAAPEGERRRLDMVLFIRDCQNIAQFELEATGGRRTAKALRHARAGVALFQRELADPTDKYHDLARPFYDGCLAVLGVGFEVGYAVAAGAPKLQGKLAPASFRAATVEEATRELEAKAKAILAQLAPTPLDTRPFVIRHGHRLVA